MISPSPSPSAPPVGHPRELATTNPKIKIIEVKARENNKVFIKVEVDPLISAYQVDWYINKKWSTNDNAAPYYLGGDNTSGPKGYILATNPAEIRPVVYYNGWNFIDAFTTFAY